MKSDSLLKVVCCLLSFGLVFGLLYKTQPKAAAPITQGPANPLVQPPIQPPLPTEPPKPLPPERIEPVWTNYPPLRTVNDSSLGKVLADIDSHMPAGHIYRDNDKITWGHETTHGINSQLRNKFQQGGVGWNGQQWLVTEQVRINGFYVLNNKAVIINEPKGTIREAAALVPQSLRGQTYKLYMVQQAGQWNDTPTYVFDEWVAYTNGSAVRLDLKITSRAETVLYMLEFNNYAIATAMACKTDDVQFKRFLMWHLERTMELYRQNLSVGDVSQATAWIEKTRSSPDAEALRAFARQYFGAEWTQRVLGY